jgi:hypothetical protein
MFFLLAPLVAFVVPASYQFSHTSFRRLAYLALFCPKLTDGGIGHIEKKSGLKRLFLNNIPQLTSGVLPSNLNRSLGGHVHRWMAQRNPRTAFSFAFCSKLLFNESLLISELSLTPNLEHVYQIRTRPTQ